MYNLPYFIIFLTIITFLYYLQLPPPIVLIRKDKKITCCGECMTNNY